MANIFGNLFTSISDWLKPKKAVTPTVPISNVSMQSIPGRVPGEKGVQFNGLGESTQKSIFPTTTPSWMQPAKQQSTIANPGKAATPTFSAPVVPQVKTPVKLSAPVITPSSPVIPPVTPPVTPETPPATTPAPVVPSATQDAQNAAEKAYQESIKISPDELSTQEDIDRLIESTKEGYRKTSNQPVAMDFITGQLKAIEQRATGLAEPLEAKLARLQAARTSATEASKFALERADKDVETETTAAQTAKTEAESARRFGITQSNEEAKLAEDKRQNDLNYNLSVKKFEEDKRQFGETNAIAKRDVAIKEAKATADAVGNATVSNSLDNYQLVNDVLDNAGAISGVFQPGLIPFTSGSATLAKYNTLKGILSLENRKLLKGSGAISDFESRTLEKAASSLSRLTKQSDFIKELNKIKSAFATAAGMEANVKVTAPNGEVVISTASRKEIDNLILEGNSVEYQ